MLNWSSAKSIKMVDEDYGCVWAPDILFDEKLGRYMVHWSSPHKNENYEKKKIFYSLTEDFENFTLPKILYQHCEKEVIDSCTFQDKGKFYCFVKIEGKDGIRLLESNRANEGYQYVTVN